MQTLIKTSLAAALSLAAISPALADEQIVVHSQAEMDQWQADVTRNLDRRLEAAQHDTNVTPKSGIVQLRFTLDENGRAENFQTLTSSGDRSTDMVATRAVRRLGNLDDAPVANAEGQTYQANIIFADNMREHDRLQAKLAKMESAHLARSESEGKVVSFGL
ncbi:energy transducer TonB [Altererythrobacter litoralis]|uniref:TonB family protein n=1 Tax=Altererythrobacter litoralis TaxID=3113904 RepID=A0ABU7GBZ0_9SPHN|nr:TonB family protein [Erythrobacteraceae bacterium 1XM1-14]